MCEEQSLNDYITEQCALIDAALDRLLPAEDESPETIHKAMRYSMFAGGKRMRPLPGGRGSLRRSGGECPGARLRRGNDAHVFPYS